MGCVKKINDEYYIEFYARGLLYQQKAGKDLPSAQKLLDEIEGKIQKGEMGTLVREIDVPIFLKTFLEFAKENESTKSYYRYEDVIKHFSLYLDQKLSVQKKLSEITPGVIESYLSSLRKESVKPKLLNLTLFLLRNILEHAIRLQYLNDNPAIHARYLGDPHKRPVEVLGEEQWKKIFNDPQFKEIVKILRKQKIDMKSLAKRAGLERPLTLSLFRNSFARYLLNQGVSLARVYKILGLTDVAKVMRYLPERWQSG